MQPDSSAIPHSLLQVLGLVLASSLGWLGGWLARRKREPHELRKIDAEIKSIHVSADVSQSTFHLETLKELQKTIEKAEKWREDSYTREDQLRTQVVFWRNKSEEIDGQLADAQESIWKAESQTKLDKLQIDKLTAHRDMLRNLLDEKEIDYPDWDGK